MIHEFFQNIIRWHLLLNKDVNGNIFDNMKATAGAPEYLNFKETLDLNGLFCRFKDEMHMGKLCRNEGRKWYVYVFCAKAIHFRII